MKIFMGHPDARDIFFGEIFMDQNPELRIALRPKLSDEYYHSITRNKANVSYGSYGQIVTGQIGRRPVLFENPAGHSPVFKKEMFCI
jgi:hypothetical protein